MAVYSEMLAEENAQPTKTKRLSTPGLSFASSLGDLARAGKCLSLCGLWHAQVTQPLLELQALSSANNPATRQCNPNFCTIHLYLNNHQHPHPPPLPRLRTDHLQCGNTGNEAP